jgi:exonuclease SbcC
MRMKPRRISIEGLNSFIDKQEIDFCKLTERGLFGIFGPTGSGKSTILDAMTIALYGDISRGSRDYINSNKNELKVSYEFEIGPKGNRKIYKVERCIKRDKKDKSRYNTSVARLIDITGEEPQILSDKKRDTDEKVKEILGLSFDDFTRSVVLPQGKFSDFLKLQPSNRNNMMERLFGLERYGNDLIKKVKRHRDIYKEKLLVVNTQIEGFGDISSELYENKKAELEVLIDEEKTLKDENKRLNEKYKKYGDVWELKNELKGYMDKMNKLKEKEDYINELKLKLNSGKRALSIKPFADRVNGLNGDVVKSEGKLKNLNKAFEDKKKLFTAAEDDYKKALSRKNNELPILIRREGELNQAIEIEDKKGILEKEKDAALKEYFKVKDEYEGHEKDLKEITDNKDLCQKTIDNLTFEKGKIKVEPEKRNKVVEGSRVEEKYNEALRTVESLNLEYNKIQQLIVSEKKAYEEALNSKNSAFEEGKNLSNSLDKILKSCPGDEETVLKSSEKVETLKHEYEEILSSTALKEKYEKEKKDAELLFKNEKTAFDKMHSKLDKAKSKENEIKNNIEKLKEKNMAYILSLELSEGKPCPVCGSVHHTVKPQDFDEGKLKAEELKLSELENQIVELENEDKNIQIKIAEYEKVIQIKNEEILKLRDKIGDKESSSIKSVIDLKENELDTLKENIKLWKKKVEDCRGELEIKNNAKVKLLSVEAKAGESLNKNIEKLNEISAKRDENGKLLESLKAQYENYKKLLNTEDISGLLNKINLMDKKFEELSSREKALRDKMSGLEKEKEQTMRDMNDLGKGLGSIKQIGQEKRKSIEEYESKLLILCKEGRPKEELKKVAGEIETINRNEKELNEKLSTIKLERENLNRDLLSENQNEKNLKENLSFEQEELNRVLKENGFDNLNEALKSVASEGELKSYEIDINEYKDNVTKGQADIDRTIKKLNGRDIKGDEWEEIKNKKDDVEKKLEGSSKERIRAEKEIEDMKKNIEKVNELKKTKKSLEKELDLVNEIDRLIKGNKFVEFVGTSQLRYIAKDATVMLSYITRGRYELELSGDGSFVICDNANGGIRRSTESLSGGELFLTSLSLALALSSQIQLKGNAPLEFFFLDEGFGSLDSSLLDTVMNALEMLHNERLCIGIISHVEELKNRVPVRLILEPAKNGNGTVIKELEYS